MTALEPEEREAIIGRVELGLSYAELAAAMRRPSADAARMAVGRALLKLAKRLRVLDRPSLAALIQPLLPGFPIEGTAEKVFNQFGARF